MKTANANRGIVYLRQSTGNQEHSLGQQLDWALQKSHEMKVELNITPEQLVQAEQGGVGQIGDLYLDNAITGGDMNRPGFLAFCERAAADNGISHCFFWARNRFARPEQAEVAVRFEKEILSGGCHTVTSQSHFTPRSRFDDRMGEDLQMFVEYSRAGEYRMELARGVLRGQKQNAEQGYSSGGRPPYGFVRALIDVKTNEIKEVLSPGRRVKESGFRVVLIPGEDEESMAKLEIVRRIASEYNNGHKGLKAIARDLNEEGIPSPAAGRIWMGKPHSGKWSESSVRTILEQPLYMSEVCWGRRSEGSLYRFDPSSPGGSRETTLEEVNEESGKGKKIVKRDYDTWESHAPAFNYEPIISRHIWLANHEKLKARGQRGGTRGIKRCKQPNKYPVEVICGQCGQPMAGMKCQGRIAYKCATYHAKGKAACSHNWVERDLVVAFCINALKNLLKANSKGKKNLEQQVREVIKQNQTLVKSAYTNVDILKRERDEYQYKAKEAYMSGQDASDSMERQIFDEAFQENLTKAKILRKQIGELDGSALLQGIDIDDEVAKTMAILDELHLFMEDIPDTRLRETFTALGARLTVHFGAPKQKGKRRKSVPLRAELVFGKGKPIDLPDRMLSKDGRGDRI